MKRSSLTAELREEIDRNGLENASFDSITKSVALQHGRNVANELQAARLREAAPAAERAPADVGTGIA